MAHHSAGAALRAIRTRTAGWSGSCRRGRGGRRALAAGAQLYIRGEVVGGSDIVAELHASGELARRIRAEAAASA